VNNVTTKYQLRTAFKQHAQPDPKLEPNKHDGNSHKCWQRKWGTQPHEIRRAPLRIQHKA
jgi:hypothetical protein